MPKDSMVWPEGNTNKALEISRLLSAQGCGLCLLSKGSSALQAGMSLAQMSFGHSALCHALAWAKGMSVEKAMGPQKGERPQQHSSPFCLGMWLGLRQPLEDSLQGLMQAQVD